MTRITGTNYMDFHESNDNTDTVYFMREVFVSFQQARYIPAGIGGPFPEKYRVVVV